MEGKPTATLVGSFKAPDWLYLSPNRAAALNHATMIVLYAQLRAGIQLKVDGEFARFDPTHPKTNGMIEYFLSRMGGVSSTASAAQCRAFRKRPGMEFRDGPPGVVTGELDAGTLDLGFACQKSVMLAQGPLKFCLTRAHMLAATAVDRHYGDKQKLAMALAGVLAEQVSHLTSAVVQVDEANITGHPEDGPWAAEAMNVILDAVPKSAKAAVHLCFGNYGGQRIQSGTWKALIPYINALRADHVVLECACFPDEVLLPLADIDPRIGLGIGVIDVKDLRIESPEAVARNIERMAKIVGRDRITCVHPDCGFWMLPEEIAFGKMESLVKGRNLVYAAAA